jgi:predicted dehydrogenase
VHRPFETIKLIFFKEQIMRFLIVGLGSMGKRRIRNLQELQAGEIFGFDIRADRRAEATELYGIETFSDFDEAMDKNPDALIISTPPDKHMQYARVAAERGKHFFTEASVVDDGMEEVMALCEGKALVAAPSCTMRFHPSVRLIKELIEQGEIGDILGLTYHCGQYLPDWHPWEDYRSFYVAQRATGGCREIVPFELVWLIWVLGEVETISCFKDKLSSLDVDIDDLYQMLLRFKRGTIGHLLVDVISRSPYRSCRFISERGVIEWVWSEKQVRVFKADTGEWQNYPEPEGGKTEGSFVAPVGMYVEELNAFVRAAQGEGEYPYTFAEDKRVLNLLYAAEKSSDQHLHLQVK